MALNFSHRPFFPAHLSEDNLVSPMRIHNGYLADGISERNGDGFGRPWHSNRDVEDPFDYGRDRCDKGSSQEPVSNDIIDLLPSDPFGMDISTTFTAITGWLEDLEMDYGCYGRDDVGTSNGNYELFAGLNFIWNNAMRFQTFPGNLGVDRKSKVASGFNGCFKEKRVGDTSSHGGLVGCLKEEQVGDASSLGGFIGCSKEKQVVDASSHGGLVGCSKEKQVDDLSCHGGLVGVVDSSSHGGLVGCSKEKQVVVVDSSCHGGLVGVVDSSSHGGLVGYSKEKQVVDPPCHGGLGGCLKEKGIGDASDASSFQGDFESACAVADILSFRNETCGFSNQQNVEPQHVNGICSVGDGGAHDGALMLALSYLGVRDLLVVERVCRSLYSTVRGDPLMWRSIHIDQPLNEKITDEVLLQLTDRAQGNLQCLSLVECPRITDDGLKRVLENNPRLTKLSVPGCTRLSIEGIVNSLKAFKSKGAHGVKHLRIGGLYGVTQKHFEELKSLLGTDSQMQQNARKPHFYHRGNFYLSCDDDSDIDIEMCPRCQNLRLVYDCPAEACQGKEHTTQLCRACTLCIGRCAQCGRCINDSEYEETFCLELLCSDCWKQLLKSQEGEDTEFVPSNSAVFHEQNHSFCRHG
ncbi:F-box protein SKIP14 isoform X2 [Rosa chinensis]|uniref:F-box protein SKIP14 isoform X2 n=1 Tax=Rosa chinensis TaxID=74649 RepID=UPI000D088B24|nr:F-box protein SKIP14 isoform X2 [Rosa chinensis]